MLDIKNTVINNLNTRSKRLEAFIRLKGLLDIKANTYLQWTSTKNQVNRASDYHYLCLPVQQSTAPVNGIDYIHPSVKPTVDYATAVITKGLAPNGEINFEFTADHEGDADGARQSTNMVSKIVNQMNDPHHILTQWVMDACMHKNGMMMVLPIREHITRYVTTEGTADQLRAFEQQAADSGLKTVIQSRRKANVDMSRVMQEAQSFMQGLPEQQKQAELDQRISAFETMDESNMSLNFDVPDLQSEQTEDMLSDAITRNTIYSAKYKLTGYNINVQFRSIAQHYWFCDPTVTQIKDQPFCGFYDDITIAEATELYPDINLEEFSRYAAYNQNGAYQAGSVLNNMAIHARDSVPVQGIPVGSGQAADEYQRRITVLTVWTRYDIDNDGELELIEVVYSGSYIISAKEVEFIPVANMCPKPLPGNFYGMSIAESVVPMQEYATAAARAEIALGLLTATPRMGVKADRVDFQMLQDGEAAIFLLDSKFNPATDIYQVPPPSGNLAFLDTAINRIQQDTMAMIGMTTPQDTFNPEVMKPGNSGIKLQLAMSPNQIIQDNTVRCAANGLKDALWLTWRTLVQYGDDYGVKKLAALYHPEGKAEFIDAEAWDEMSFTDRKQMGVELAIGMMSEENSIARVTMIQQAQTQLYTACSTMTAAGTLTPEMFKKVKKPFEDILYVLNVKDPDSYLPSDEEVAAMIEQAQKASQSKEPSPGDKKDLSSAELNQAKTKEILSTISGDTANDQLEYMAMAMGHPKVYNG
tara:strand:- start:5039 stop:7309 length:2271 start_codon:yes stop_codon:yes gene_type:complete